MLFAFLFNYMKDWNLKGQHNSCGCIEFMTTLLKQVLRLNMFSSHETCYHLDTEDEFLNDEKFGSHVTLIVDRRLPICFICAHV